MRLFRAEGSTLRPIRERAGSGPGGKLEKKIKKNRGTEDRIWTRRRPKRTGLPSSLWLRRDKMSRHADSRIRETVI